MSSISQIRLPPTGNEGKLKNSPLRSKRNLIATDCSPKTLLEVAPTDDEAMSGLTAKEKYLEKMDSMLKEFDTDLSEHQSMAPGTVLDKPWLESTGMNIKKTSIGTLESGKALENIDG